MGYTVAAEAARRGARVVLVSGPSSQPIPPNVEIVRVRTATEMHDAILRSAPSADVIIMAAAVADYMPRLRAEGKIAKSDAPLALDLVRTPDILADLGRARGQASRPVLIGFAAESGDPVPRARLKLSQKRVDMIVANDISRPDAGFDTDTNAVTLITADAAESVPLAHKAQIAATILDRAERMVASRPAPAAFGQPS
jgi:phosphopantothenoylcysteine decarboxylase / phosphopantothenate---cysteine ligase